MFDFLDNPAYNLTGAFWLTIQLAFWSAIGSLIWGTVLAAFRVSPVPIMRGFGAAYVNIVRNIPLTVIIFFSSLGMFYALGLALSDPDSPTSIMDNNFRWAIIGFIAYTSTFVCESLRSGINTVPVGQAEAARALGLKFSQVLGLIVLPQAFRSVIAPLASVMIALIKNTTVAAVIGVAEAAVMMRTMIENESDKILLVFAIFALGFVLLTLPIGLALGWVSKKVAVKR